jgi:hypothetical protein
MTVVGSSRASVWISTIATQKPKPAPCQRWRSELRYRPCWPKSLNVTLYVRTATDSEHGSRTGRCRVADGRPRVRGATTPWAPRRVTCKATAGNASSSVTLNDGQVLDDLPRVAADAAELGWPMRGCGHVCCVWGHGCSRGRHMDVCLSESSAPSSSPLSTSGSEPPTQTAPTSTEGSPSKPSETASASPTEPATSSFPGTVSCTFCGSPAELLFSEQFIPWSRPACQWCLACRLESLSSLSPLRLQPLPK